MTRCRRRHPAVKKNNKQRRKNEIEKTYILPAIVVDDNGKLSGTPFEGDGNSAILFLL